jgi:hypothetical protein
MFATVGGMITSMSRPLSPEHAEHLARFCIPPDILEAAGVRSVTDAYARETLGINGHRGDDLSGVLFIYLSPLTGKRTGGRIRLNKPLSDDGGKYIMEPGCRHLYFPPNVAAFLSDVVVPVIIVEAEKSSLAITALAERVGRKMLAIAIGGCSGWKRKIGKRLRRDGDSTDETGPSPDLDLITWQGRWVVLAFDSNASTSLDVRKARRKLAKELSARGAIVAIAEVSAEPGVNGPDDLVAISGDEATLRMLDSARRFAECAVAEAENAIAVLEANKKSDSLPAIEAIAAIEDPKRRALVIGRLVALRLPGVTRKFIEQQVCDRRDEAEADSKKASESARRGRLMAMDIQGADLLDEICAFIQRFVSLLGAQAQVLALWIVHTHAFAAADCTPYLSITSAEKQSGKSRLQEVLETIVANPWYTGRVTAPVLYRKVDAEGPTLLLDESDAAFKSGEEYGEALRGILNTGHRRGGKATCCVGQGASISYQDFSTFSPKAIAGIGRLPDTVADRSIPIRLKRKARAEKVDRFRLRNVRTQAERLHERLEAWCAQNIERLREATPGLPEELSDRQQDGAEPLLAIADLAGGEWPETARHALVLLCCGAQAEDGSIGTLLLSDIRHIFITQDTDRLPSAELASALEAIETSPWGEWNHGKPITPIGVARLLKPFDITPHPVRNDDRVFRGYEKTDFGDAWGRYVDQTDKGENSPAGNQPGPANVTTLQGAPGAASSDFQSVTTSEAVTVQKIEKPAKNGLCNAVTPSGSPTDARTQGMEEEL